MTAGARRALAVAFFAALFAVPRLALADALPAVPPEYLHEKTDGFEFDYHPSVRERVRPLVEDAARARAELEAILGRAVLPRVVVRIGVSVVDLERVLPEGASAGREVTVVGSARLVAFSAEADDAVATRAFREGLAELALGDATNGPLPVWFRVGFVRFFAVPRSLSRSRTAWLGSLTGPSWSLEELDRRLAEDSAAGSLPEAEAVERTSALLGDPGGFHRLIAECARSSSGAVAGTFEEALAAAYRTDAQGWQRRWDAEAQRVRVASWACFAALSFLLGTAVMLAWRRALDRRPVVDEPPPAPRSCPPISVRTVRAVRAFRSSQTKPSPPLAQPDAELPRVSHDGRWHTLH